MRAAALSLLLAGVLLSATAGAASMPGVVAKIRVAANAQPCAAAPGGGYVWVSEYASPWLLKIDTRTNRVISKTPIGFGSCGLGYGAGSIWIEDTSSSTLSRVSVRTGKRIKAIPVGAIPYDATFAYGSAWVTSHGSGDLERVDPARNRVVKRFTLGSATGVVAAFGSIWATGTQGVLRVDPATNAVVATIPVENAGWTAASRDAVWINGGDGIVRIDPATNAVVADVKLPAYPLGDPAVVGGRVWVPEVRSDTVAIVAPLTNRVAQTVKVGSGPFVITEIAGDAWIPSWHGRDIWRLRP